MNNNFLNDNSKLEYLNSFAAIFEDGFLLHKHNPRNPIKIESIKKVILAKKRILTLNWTLFSLGVITLLICLYFNEFYHQIITITFLTFGTFLILVSFLLKKYRYKFILLKNDKATIEIRVEKNLITDAKAITKIMSKKLKNL